ncbi:MAG: electron transfer flavoprotein subunit beta/FixA family protein, partial [Candidatus Binatia bacterium]
MKYVVLVKQVPDVSEMQFDPGTRRLRREGVRLEVSSFDVRALLRALELRAGTGGEVVAVTMGPPQARDALVHCLALGADRGVHLVDPAFAGSDTLATARALALALRREGFDLVLCGKSSVDAETGQVGPEVAELLDVPQVTAARRLDLDAERRRLKTERETDFGFESVECQLPALVSAAEDLAAERFPKRAEKEAAKAKPITEVSAAELSADPQIFGAAGSPTRVEGLEAVDVQREGRMLGSDLSQAIPELVSLLVERGLFTARRSRATAVAP